MTTKHATCTHASTKAARAACRRGTAQPTPKASKPAASPEPEAKPAAPRPPAPPAIFIDSLGVKIEEGDRVIINAWGGNVRLTDVGSRGTVTGYGRTRVYVLWDDLADFPAGAVRADLIAVLRRDGKQGLEGNVDR